GRAALVHRGHESAPVDGPRHRFAQACVVKGRLLRVEDEVIDHAGEDSSDHELRRGLLELVGDGPSGLAGKGDVDSTRLEGGSGCSTLRDDQVAPGVGIGPSLRAILGGPYVLHELSPAPLLYIQGA